MGLHSGWLVLAVALTGCGLDSLGRPTRVPTGNGAQFGARGGGGANRLPCTVTAPTSPPLWGLLWLVPRHTLRK
jgi:hypothetical protein